MPGLCQSDADVRCYGQHFGLHARVSLFGISYVYICMCTHTAISTAIFSQLPVSDLEGFFTVWIWCPEGKLNALVNFYIAVSSVIRYGDGAGNTIEENSSVFSLIRMRVASSALTLLVGWQEGHPACKKYGGWWRWALVTSLDGMVPIWMVGVSASVNLPLHHKVQKFSSGTGSPGWSQKKGRKTVVVLVWCFISKLK